jgi:hypothetical protein
VAHEVIPVDFRKRQRLEPWCLAVLKKIDHQAANEHVPGTLPEIGPAGLVVHAAAEGIPEPEMALTREEMIVKASKAIVSQLMEDTTPEEEASQLLDEALLPLDDEEIDIAWQKARFETDLM